MSQTDWYSNETLTTRSGDLSVVVYLPRGIKANEPVFYDGSRFDHSSMIGSVTRKKHSVTADGTKTTETHVLYTPRLPRNSRTPSSGVGLASEFGTGDNGASCSSNCGWTGAKDVLNGVLGYDEAKNGDPFLKIGVGALTKGSCSSCDSSGSYMFNSQYAFYGDPEWNMEKIQDNTVRLTQKAALTKYGYKLVKEVTLMRDTLKVTSTLTNLGSEPFSTVWYSHNFFACDGVTVGPGYGLTLDVAGKDGTPYDETDMWTKPLKQFAVVKAQANSVRVDMGRALGPDDKIKSYFKKDDSSKGSFRIEACGTSVDTTIPQLDKQGKGISLHAFNLYIERGIFSPEPFILVHLQPGSSKTWTQKLVFGDADTTKTISMPSSSKLPSIQGLVSFLCVVAVGFISFLPYMRRRRDRRRRRQFAERFTAYGWKTGNNRSL